MAITASQLIATAKKLEGYKATAYSCTPNNWFYGYNVGGDVAWCAATVCYWFHQAGADSLIPEMSVNCGVLARGFYDKGQLVKSGYKAGDVVFFHWSNDWSSSVPGVYTLDHVGLIISANSDGSYTTIEGNTGSSAYGECAIRTRYSYQISCAGRPKYGSSSSNNSGSNSGGSNSTKVTKPNVWCQVCTAEDGWLPVAKNLEKCAGKDGHAITKVAIKVDKGSVWYQAHVKGGDWLGKVTGWDYKEPINGYAGNGKPIDALRVYYTTPSDLRNAGKVYCAQYKVSPTNSSAFYDWQIDTETGNGMDGYAGAFGVAMDKLYVNLI
jgi:hypothetical protein